MESNKGVHGQTSACLPVDQSCFALSRLSISNRNDPHACCSTTTYLEVLGISFASLLVILSLLCVIRCYLMAVDRAAAEAAAMAVKKPRAGLGEEAISALPMFEYRSTGEECDRWECAICLSAMADGEVARQLPRCMHLFHRGCIDMWLTTHTTCPVCRAELVKPPDGDRCTEEPPADAGISPAPAPAPETASLEDGERDLEAQ